MHVVAGIFFKSVDNFNEDSENQISEVERSNTTPLLQEKTGGTETAASTSIVKSQEC